MTAPSDDPPMLANGLPRPLPPVTLRDRFEDFTAQAMDRIRSRRELSTPEGGAQTADSLSRGGRSRRALSERAENRPVLVTVLAAATAALTTVGAVWLWQSWVARPAPAIEDLIPLAESPISTAPVDPVDGEPGPSPGPNTTPAGAPQTAVAAASAQSGRESVRLDAEDRSSVAAGQIAIHIAGAVAKPGVVYLAADSRVVDAVLAGGGAVASADLDRLNLALPVEDGQQIYVPRADEDVPDTAANSPSQASLRDGSEFTEATAPELLDLNRASELELQSLPGIGPTMAAAIVGYRESVGGFVAVDELVNVSGIGPTRLETLRPLVAVVDE